MIFGDNRLPKRFWDKVQPEPNTGCWLWTGADDGNGRAVVGWNGRPVRAYVLTTELEHGPRPDGKECSHLCDNKICVNPQHVVYETHQENKARRTGKAQRNRNHPEFAHLPPHEYKRKARNKQKLLKYHRQKEAKKCD
jgi:hypothetical protein